MQKNFLHRVWLSVQLPLALVVIMWVVELTKYVLGENVFPYYQLGILPRNSAGLPGILTGPLIHGSFNHLISNTMPFFVLSGMLMYFYANISKFVLLLIWVATSAMVWSLGFDDTIWHIGASGVVYGLAAFLVASGIFRGNVRAVALSLLVVTFYSGMFWGLLKREEGISWESHFYGALVGVFIAWLFRHTREVEELPAKPLSLPDPEREYFLPRDAFELTKEERERNRLLEEELGSGDL